MSFRPCSRALRGTPVFSGPAFRGLTGSSAGRAPGARAFRVPKVFNSPVILSSRPSVSGQGPAVSCRTRAGDRELPAERSEPQSCFLLDSGGRGRGNRRTGDQRELGQTAPGWWQTDCAASPHGAEQVEQTPEAEVPSAFTEPCAGFGCWCPSLPSPRCSSLLVLSTTPPFDPYFIILLRNKCTGSEGGSVKPKPRVFCGTRPGVVCGEGRLWALPWGSPGPLLCQTGPPGGGEGPRGEARRGRGTDQQGRREEESRASKRQPPRELQTL